ncbi:hypothetical protein N7448_002266 [Penicillium atrosanguineum]|nr:hypothetical protein N7448_002266 [Penicillium atrosanguineum]
MSDPFSVAGSAVGVISLGLQVCQQLTSYCQAYNSYDEEIKKIGSRSESLQRPLKDLRELIEEARAKDPEIATDLADKALNLQSMVNSLRGTIDRMIPTMTANTQGKIRSQVNKVIYPFRRETLRDMLRDLDGIQVVLQTTLSIYSTQKITSGFTTCFKEQIDGPKLVKIVVRLPQ